MKALICWLIGLSWTIAAAATSSAAPVNDFARALAGPFEPSISVYLNAGPTDTIDAVLGLTDRFEPVDPRRSYPVSDGRPLWVHIRGAGALGGRASGGQDVALVLEFPTALVDRYEFFQRDTNGVWQMSAAGDRVAHRDWPLDSLRPRFPIHASESGGSEAFVRVVHKMPTFLRPVLLSSAASHRMDVDSMLWGGLLIGVICALVFSCAQLSLTYRDATYAWYGGYLVFTAISALAYQGVGQQALWPSASTFSGMASVFALFGALACHLMFTQTMFGSLLRTWHRLMARVLSVGCVIYAVHVLLNPNGTPSLFIFHTLFGSAFCCIIAMAGVAWRSGSKYGAYWLALYVPYLLGMAITVADSSGLFASPWLPPQFPAMLTTLESIAMMLCLNAYSRLRHAQAVQREVAAQHDPLTGFLTEPVFRARAAEAWNAANGTQRDVAMILVAVSPARGSKMSTIDAEALMARSVRLVRTVTRETDLVGRLGSDQIGLLFVGVKPGEGLSARLSRLVGLGLMGDSNDPQDRPIKFEIVAGLRSYLAEGFEQVIRRLQANHPRGERSAPKPIIFLDSGPESWWGPFDRDSGGSEEPDGSSWKPGT